MIAVVYQVIYTIIIFMVKFDLARLLKGYDKKSILMIFGLVALMLCIAGGGVYYYNYKLDKRQAEIEAFERTTKIANDEFLDMNKYQLQALSGDVEGARDGLLSELKLAKTDKDKIIIYNKLGRIYVNSKDKSISKGYVSEALKIQDNADSWNVLGHIAASESDWKTAVDAYQKAVNLSDGSLDGRSQSSEYVGLLNEARANL